MLTRKQYELLIFINKYLNEQGVSPSFDEMKDALGLRSKSGIHRLMMGLEERGFIRRLPHRARALEELAAAQASEPGLTFEAFMTRSVSAMVQELYAVVLEARPTAALSAAVWGIHTALPGCSTSEGANDYHQDSWAWASGGFIDALCPMSYWDIEDGSCTDWAALLDDFLLHTGGRPLWMGMHALDNGFEPARIAARVELARARGAAGTVVFASAYLDENDGWSALRGTCLLYTSRCV